MRIAVWLHKLVVLCLFFSCLSCEINPEGVDPKQLDKWSYYTTSKGLADDYITVIYEDKDGDMWFGHDGYGVTRYDGKTFTTFGTSDGLTDNTVYTIYQDSEGDLLFGTGNGLSIKRGDDWLYFIPLDGIPIRAILEDKDGVVWFGSWEYGVLFYDGSDLYQAFDNECIACNYVYSIIQDEDDRLWFATEGGLKSYDGNDIEHYTTADGLAGNEIRALTEDAWGNIWIGSADGDAVTRLYKKSFDKVSLSNSAPVVWITSIVPGTAGELWLGTVAYGLVHYDGAVMRKVFDGPPDNTITSLYKDRKGNLWVGTLSEGVARYTTR